ncbi:hypothetical protein V8C37DRAFT_372260 [Trichoderma ceciliae]
MAGISEHWSSLISSLSPPPLSVFVVSSPVVAHWILIRNGKRCHTLNSSARKVGFEAARGCPSYTSRPLVGGLDIKAPHLYDSLKPAPTSYCRVETIRD